MRKRGVDMKMGSNWAGSDGGVVWRCISKLCHFFYCSRDCPHSAFDVSSVSLIEAHEAMLGLLQIRRFLQKPQEQSRALQLKSFMGINFLRDWCIMTVR